MPDNTNQMSGSTKPHKSIRKRVVVDVGALVQHESVVYRIAEVLDFESVVGIAVETGRSAPLRIGELQSVSLESDAGLLIREDLTQIADSDWLIASRRFAAIKPLINRYRVGRDAVSERAQEIGVDTATLYRWLKRYETHEVITALVPQKRGWKQGNGRITKAADEVIKEVIENYYLTSQRPTVQKAVTEVKRICGERCLDIPSPSTIRSRITKIPEEEFLRRRGYKEKAKNKFMPAAGSFPNADFPLSVIQIDHTPLDIILVDDVHRKPTSRPWLTLAIDVYSRMVVGYYLSFDSPSEASVALCVAHACLPKEEWLVLHKVDAQWPVWGIPRTIHVDNGADFRSNNFQKSCLMYGISLEYRPVKQPRYGGHIERMLGTLLKEIHNLPGTTFSSVKDREGYEAEKHAVMTISEFETWLVTYICKVYHQRLHSRLGMAPSRKWEIGIFGNAEVQGVGLPPRPADRLSLLLDFLPAYQRTIQPVGVKIDGMKYYDEALRPWINATDLNTGKKQMFAFRRDPRDISVIWFYDPTLKQYYKVPFADQSLPSMSIWEYRQAKEKLKKEGADNINEHQILQAITEMRSQVDASSEKTKSARRKAQRRKQHEKKTSPAVPINKKPSTLHPKHSLDMTSELVDGDIDAYGDIA